MIYPRRPVRGKKVHFHYIITAKKTAIKGSLCSLEIETFFSVLLLKYFTYKQL